MDTDEMTSMVIPNMSHVFVGSLKQPAWLISPHGTAYCPHQLVILGHSSIRSLWQTLLISTLTQTWPTLSDFSSYTLLPSHSAASVRPTEVPQPGGPWLIQSPSASSLANPTPQPIPLTFFKYNLTPFHPIFSRVHICISKSSLVFLPNQRATYPLSPLATKTSQRP